MSLWRRISINRLRSAELSGENDKLRRELERTTKILEVGGLKHFRGNRTYQSCNLEMHAGSGAAEASGRGQDAGAGAGLASKRSDGIEGCLCSSSEGACNGLTFPKLAQPRVFSPTRMSTAVLEHT